MGALWWELSDGSSHGCTLMESSSVSSLVRVLRWERFGGSVGRSLGLVEASI